MTRYEPDELPGCSTPHSYYIGCARFRQIRARCRKVQANWRNDFVKQAGSGYHSLYGVFSKGETRGEFE